MTRRNRYQLVDREKISGRAIRGIDFGNNLSCIARSPTQLLLWSGGTSYYGGIGQSRLYGESSLQIFPRTGAWKFNHLSEGGRLTENLIRDPTVETALMKAFGDDDEIIFIRLAVRQRKTLLIEGGGGVLEPRATSYSDPTLAAWRKNQNRSDR